MRFERRPARVVIPQRGLPRPEDGGGTPIPYIASYHHDGTPDWRQVDTQLVVECQAAWLCQVCGLELERRAWIMVDGVGEVVSGTAMHQACMSIATTRCPHLKGSPELHTLEIDRTQILADGVVLASLPIVEHCDDFGSYGSRIRFWRVADSVMAQQLSDGSVSEVSPSCLEDEREDGHTPGLPRPRSDGMPVPWTTFMLDIDDVWWRTVDTPRLLRCQAEWLCQVCGLELSSVAWVVVDCEGGVVSDAAIHRHCLAIARRWCPELKQSAYEVLPADPQRILADGVPLESLFDHADGGHAKYGLNVRRWTVQPPYPELG
ncbi:hypothetical protein [Nocardia asteroides]|uniref:hypothetical protein n=1 Tax=Nocardia asteroides TaxID=1824 RepID=UPI0033F94C8D